MAEEIPFPDGAFFIVSRLDGDSLALTLEGGKVFLRPFLGLPSQRWTAVRDARGGAMLRHLGSGDVLTYKIRRIVVPGSGTVIDLPEGPIFGAQPGGQEIAQRWRAERLGDGIGLNTLLDWEYKLNVFGGDTRNEIGVRRWEGGGLQECWLLPTRSGEILLQGVGYDLAKVKPDTDLPTLAGPVEIIDNRAGGAPLEVWLSLPSTRIYEHCCRLEKADHDKLSGVSVDGAVTTGVVVDSDGERFVQPMTPVPLDDPTPRVEVSQGVVHDLAIVPAGCVYSYQPVDYFVGVQAPFEARLVFHSPIAGADPRPFLAAGMFLGVNPLGTKIVCRDITGDTLGAKAAGRADDPPIVAVLSPA